jgi:hypothetical protein
LPTFRDLTQWGVLDHLDRIVKELPPAQAASLKRRVGEARWCRKYRPHQLRDPRYKGGEPKPCLSLVCLDCRENLVEKIGEAIWSQIAHVPREQLRRVELVAPRCVPAEELECLLYNLDMARKAFMRRGSPWTDSMSLWGGRWRPGWRRRPASPRRTFRPRLPLVVRVRSAPIVRELEARWRSCLEGVGLTGGKRTNLTLTEVKNRRRAAARAAGSDDPLPATPMEMPSDVIAFFDCAEYFDKVVGARTFKRFRRVG